MELLVVIAIIGILASVVLASLSNARNKSANTIIEENLINTRAQAELYYQSNGNSYTGICNAGAIANGVKGIYEIVMAAAQASGLSAVTSNGTGTVATATCNANGTAWAVEAPLKMAIGTSVLWCVDSTNKSAGESATIGATTSCL